MHAHPQDQMEQKAVKTGDTAEIARKACLLLERPDLPVKHDVLAEP